ncbi:hypothetical protein CVS40_8653 [Lucilia cuprina]|nr:hypothetical protein CVS40_8653 [Lucilia cuprina]
MRYGSRARQEKTNRVEPRGILSSDRVLTGSHQQFPITTGGTTVQPPLVQQYTFRFTPGTGGSYMRIINSITGIPCVAAAFNVIPPFSGNIEPNIPIQNWLIIMAYLEFYEKFADSVEEARYFDTMIKQLRAWRKDRGERIMLSAERSLLRRSFPMVMKRHTNSVASGLCPGINGDWRAKLNVSRSMVIGKLNCTSNKALKCRFTIEPALAGGDDVTECDKLD